jgi:hypothetical protein
VVANDAEIDADAQDALNAVATLPITLLAVT